MATRARERLLEAAADLFYAEGIRAVGVERLLQASGVGRASFYRHFDGKDDLVVEVLGHYDVRWREWLSAQARARGGDVDAVFDALAARLVSAEYRGCLAITAMIEYRDPSHPVHRAAVDHKSAVTSLLAEFVGDGVAPRARRRVAGVLMQLIDSAMVCALRASPAEAAENARSLAHAAVTAAAEPPAA